MTDEFRMIGRSVVRSGRRALRTVVGFALLFLGLAGLVLPVLPGWVFIVAGFAVLSGEYAWARRALEWARRQAARGGDGLRTVLRRPRRRRDGAAPEGWPPEVVLAPDDVVLDLAEALMSDAVPAGAAVEGRPARR